MSLEIKIGADVSGVDKAVADVGKSLNNLQPAAQKAQNTLTGLSGVVRDLPFGFIAIQNNLPILADQFTSLSKESGGVGGALKNLGGALIGPAGIAFAFGAVTSIVTGLIQKYGSLGEAVNVLLGITKPLTEAQKAYNKASFETAGNVAAEEAKVKILTSTLLDNKKPQADRLAAYGELKKVAPDVVSGIKDENALTSESNALIEANSRLRAESVRLKVQEAGITAALTSNETKIAELRAKLATATDEYVRSAKDLNNSNKQAVITGLGSRTAQELALKAFNDNAKAVKALNAEIGVLTGENQKYLNQLDPVAIGIAKINEENRKRIEGLKTEAQEEKTTATEAKKANAEKLRGQKALTAEAAKQVQERIKRQNFENKESLDALREGFAERRKVEREQGITTPKTISGQVTPTINQGEIDKQAKAATDALQVLNREANLSAAFNLVNDTFFSPLQNLFTDLISGADGAFKAFTKAVLQSINQIVAKIIATGIISLLFNLISGGTAGLGKAVLGDIGKALGFGIGSVANPNFGGVTGGGMAMSGAVNVVLRGQDLVGSLNRTNAQINRVG